MADKTTKGTPTDLSGDAGEEIFKQLTEIKIAPSTDQNGLHR